MSSITQGRLRRTEKEIQVLKVKREEVMRQIVALDLKIVSVSKTASILRLIPKGRF